MMKKSAKREPRRGVFSHDRMGIPNSERRLDTTPVDMPLSARRPTPLHEMIARMVRSAVADEKGEDFEEFDVADDFEEEDPDTLDFSAYELTEANEEMTLADFQEAQSQVEEPTPHPDDTLEPQNTGNPPDPDEVDAG